MANMISGLILLAIGVIVLAKPAKIGSQSDRGDCLYLNGEGDEHQWLEYWRGCSLGHNDDCCEFTSNVQTVSEADLQRCSLVSCRFLALPKNPVVIDTICRLPCRELTA